MPLTEVVRQSLRHRVVLVLAHNQEGKLFLQKRAATKQLFPGRWDLSATGRVRAGESCEDAAIRELREELGLEVEQLALLGETPGQPSTQHTFISLYSTGPLRARPRPDPLELQGGMYVDRHELAFLAEQYRDMLTPALVYFWELDMLFP